MLCRLGCAQLRSRSQRDIGVFEGTGYVAPKGRRRTGPHSLNDKSVTVTMEAFCSPPVMTARTAGAEAGRVRCWPFAQTQEREAGVARELSPREPLEFPITRSVRPAERTAELHRRAQPAPADARG